PQLRGTGIPSSRDDAGNTDMLAGRERVADTAIWNAPRKPVTKFCVNKDGVGYGDGPERGGLSACALLGRELGPRCSSTTHSHWLSPRADGPARRATAVGGGGDE